MLTSRQLGLGWLKFRCWFLVWSLLGECFVYLVLFLIWFFGDCNGCMLPVFLDCTDGAFTGNVWGCWRLGILGRVGGKNTGGEDLHDPWFSVSMAIALTGISAIVESETNNWGKKFTRERVCGVEEGFLHWCSVTSWGWDWCIGTVGRRSYFYYFIHVSHSLLDTELVMYFFWYGLTLIRSHSTINLSISFGLSMLVK